MAVTKQNLDAAVKALAAIPYFPADEDTRVTIQHALQRNFENATELRRVCLTAVDTMRSWGGVATLLELRDSSDEGAAFYSRLAESDKHLALPAPAPEPLSAEEKAEIERIRLQVSESAKKFRMGAPGMKDRAASKKLLEGVL